jgi:hypothetical protein
MQTFMNENQTKSKFSMEEKKCLVN